MSGRVNGGGMCGQADGRWVRVDGKIDSFQRFLFM